MIFIPKTSLIFLIMTSIFLFSCNTSHIESTENTVVEPHQTQVPQASTSAVNIKRDLIGTWHVEYIAGRPVMDNSPAQLIFLAQGKLTGSASCNNFISSYTLDKKMNLSLTPAATTRKMCFKALTKG